jgi:hypothetical protein
MQNDDERAQRVVTDIANARHGVAQPAGSGYAPLTAEQLARATRLARHPGGQTPTGVRLGRNQWAEVLGMIAEPATVAGLTATKLNADDACEWVYD